MLFIPARNFTRVTTPPREIDVVVIHTMEYPERPTGAEWCAGFFSGRYAPKASCHYAIDADTVIQCVRDEDVAWAAPGCNHNGLQLEHTGFAAQANSEWHDAYSTAMLERSAALTANLCRKHGIPARFVDRDDLRLGLKGITTHAEVTKAFPGPGRTHWDPGPNFPMTEYVAAVKKNLERSKPKTRTPMPAEFWVWVQWRLGEGLYKGKGPVSKPRPANVRYFIPPSWWLRLSALLKARG